MDITQKIKLKEEKQVMKGKLKKIYLSQKKAEILRRR
jgi:hypothetical protein